MSKSSSSLADFCYATQASGKKATGKSSQLKLESSPRPYVRPIC